VNEATVKATGVPREQIIGTHFPDYFTEPDKAEEAYQQAFKGAVSNFLWRSATSRAKLPTCFTMPLSLRTKKGFVTRVFASARDITDRKRVEEENRKRESYTRSLIEASLDPL